jgi:hypothetical protein
MVRDKPLDQRPEAAEGRSPGDGEPAVARPGDEAPGAKELWREQDAPHGQGHYLWVSQAYAQTMSEVNDAAFLITMRNRLKSLAFERTGPLFWQRIRGFFFGAPRETPLAGFEIRRLKHIAGEAPPDALSDDRTYNVSYDLFLSMVTAAERIAAEDARPAKKTDSAD